MAKRQTQKPTTTNKANQSHVVQTFAQHISELRKRLFIIVATCLVLGGVVYNYHDFFIHLIMQPLGDQKLIYLNPAGGFNFIFSVTLYITIILAFPIILYQLYAFIRPAIPRHTKRMSMAVAVSALILMAVGVIFGYVYAVPSGLHFLTTFAGDYVTPSLTADSYLTFVLGYIFGIGMLFEVPLLLLFWHWINPLTPKGLLKSERYVIVIAFIAAAIISPTPDALNQTIIALPIIIMYQVGVVAVLVSAWRKKRNRSPVVNVHDEPAEVAPAHRSVYFSAMTLDQLKSRTATPAIVAVVQQPKKSRHTQRSIDGFTRQVTSVPHRPLPSRQMPTLSRQAPRIVMNQQRPRLVTDFGPLTTQKVVDTRII